MQPLKAQKHTVHFNASNFGGEGWNSTLNICYTILTSVNLLHKEYSVQTEVKTIMWLIFLYFPHFYNSFQNSCTCITGIHAIFKIQNMITKGEGSTMNFWRWMFDISLTEFWAATDPERREVLCLLFWGWCDLDSI